MDSFLSMRSQKKQIMHKKISHYAGRLVDIFVMPMVPHRYRLLVQYKKYTMLLGWEPETKHIKDYARVGIFAVDVGGNKGLWSYAIAKSNMFKEVLVFEPNPNLTGDLESAGFDNVTIIHKALSSVAGVNLLRIPIQGKQLLDGWASLESVIDVDTDEFQELSVETIRLDDLKLEDVGFIKIDVEGHELDLLEGARCFFTANRPVCLIECRDKNRRQVKDYFSSLHVGYAEMDVNRKYGFDLSAGNLIFAVE
jgi:FkbM family methyltransferase